MYFSLFLHTRDLLLKYFYQYIDIRHPRNKPYLLTQPDLLQVSERGNLAVYIFAPSPTGQAYKHLPHLVLSGPDVIMISLNLSHAFKSSFVREMAPTGQARSQASMHLLGSQNLGCW